MPPIFKAIVSITVWILFIHGCICLIHCGVIAMTSGIVPPLALPANAGVGIVSLILAAVAAWIRQKLQ